jgi:hypothetical protein
LRSRSSGIATQLAKAQEQLPTATAPQLTLTLVDVAVEELQLSACVATHHAGPTQPITSRTGLDNVTGITALR